MLVINVKPNDAYNNAFMKLNLDFAMHRYLTYPLHWLAVVKRDALANSGFYMLANCESLCCHYCKCVLDLKKECEGIECIEIDSKHREMSPHCALMREKAEANLPICRVKDYRFEACRLYSMLGIDRDFPVNVYEMAKNGFYWTGESDKTRCAFCKLEVQKWEPGDTAANEHQRWNPNCRYINSMAVANVPIGKETDGDYMICCQELEKIARRNEKGSLVVCYNPFARGEQSLYGEMTRNEHDSNVLRLTNTDLDIVSVKPPAHPCYSTLSSRYISYREWPMSSSIKPAQLAAAGFFYIGSEDQVICFHCGGGIKDWARWNVPWREHAKWFSRCPFVLSEKGKAFVDEVARDENPTIKVSTLYEIMKRAKTTKEAIAASKYANFGVA
jgi:hypothetical protein